MKNQDIAEDIVRYVVTKASITLDNLESGFLTGKLINSLSKDVLQDYLNTIQSMIIPYVQNYTDILDGELTRDDCVRMFQYIFDRSFEISYKLIQGKKIYTEFDPDETQDYYELDVPEYIQLKVNHVIPKTVLTFKSSYDYMKTKDYIDEDYLSWLYPLLFGAASIAMSFALEMDMNDDSEMRHYLRNE